MRLRRFLMTEPMTRYLTAIWPLACFKVWTQTPYPAGRTQHQTGLAWPTARPPR